MIVEPRRAGPSRREFFGLVGAAALWPITGPVLPASRGLPRRSPGHPFELAPPARPFRVRTITAGLRLDDPADSKKIESALDLLDRAKSAFEAEGYEVETLRVATQPLVGDRSSRARDELLVPLRALDRLVTARSALLSIGPALGSDDADPAFAPWAAELAGSTKSTSFTAVAASPDRGPHLRAAQVIAEAMIAIAEATQGGVGNFRFAAAANVPPGTPFFPVAYHEGPAGLAVGLESASLVEEVFAEVASLAARGRDAGDATSRLRDRLQAQLEPVERTASELARREGLSYLGIDPSPAPAGDVSIGAAIEALTGVPFGSASTLRACAAVTGAVKSLRVRTCGYAGLMLPVLEDAVLAKRAGEDRYGLRELLLYSSVCGTGLDVVPLPGDTPAETLARLIGDVATLSAKLAKPLSARLFVVPGKGAGEMARFDDPRLTECVVFRVE